MASVTARAYAELIHTPLYDQIRILREQKYPLQTSGQFRIPYYQPTIRNIRRYYQSGNDPEVLPTNAASLRGCGSTQSKIDHNLRSLNAFRRSRQFSRRLVIQQLRTYEHSIHNITVRATADIVATEGANSTLKYILYNCREHLPDQEIVHTTIDLFHYILEQNSMFVPIRNIEYVCIDRDIAFNFTSRRVRTIHRANVTAAGIDAMWSTL